MDKKRKANTAYLMRYEIYSKLHNEGHISSYHAEVMNWQS